MHSTELVQQCVKEPGRWIKLVIFEVWRKNNDGEVLFPVE